MHPSQILRSGGGPEVGKYGVYIGNWGNFGTPKQRGIVYYGLSANAQRPLAGTLHAAFFNTFRRVRGQILYVVPPFVLAYVTMSWAIERNHYLNSKPGRAETAAAENE